ncbi:hypothetical protein HY477_02925 [Candidatus Uhrbacteria bacterium]|nr:hypothetical protein [Candidatus Uhrbacteria bacterium]
MQMRNASLLVLRLSLAVTFVWIGFFIAQDPESWGTGFIKPWAQELLPVPLLEIMKATAVLDIVVGLVLLSRKYGWIAGAVGSLHLLGVLIVAGVDAITIRDVGLLGATLAFTFATMPESVASKLKLTKTSN